MNNELLSSKLSSLKYSKESSFAYRAYLEVCFELRDKGFKFIPHLWVGDQWFCPDGYTGISMPFYLFDSRLMKIEKEIMGNVEGGTLNSCKKLIRHEFGHAIDNAFKLRQSKERQLLFGRSSMRYPKSYLPNKYSKDFVRYIEDFYAQSHPDEDFAETFAVWLDPNSKWKKKYKNWGCLKKLQFIDREMNRVSGELPLIKRRRTLDDIKTLSVSLKTYYKRKIKEKKLDKIDSLKRDFKEITSTQSRYQANLTLDHFIRVNKVDCIKILKEENISAYEAERAITTVINLSKFSKLKLKSNRTSKQKTLELITKYSIKKIKSGEHRVIM